MWRVPFAPRQVQAGAEGVAAAGDGDDPDIVVLHSGVHRLDHTPGQLGAQGILLIGAVQGDGADMPGVPDLDQLAHGMSPFLNAFLMCTLAVPRMTPSAAGGNFQLVLVGLRRRLDSGLAFRGRLIQILDETCSDGRTVAGHGFCRTEAHD